MSNLVDMETVDSVNFEGHRVVVVCRIWFPNYVQDSFVKVGLLLDLYLNAMDTRTINYNKFCFSGRRCSVQFLLGSPG